MEEVNNLSLFAVDKFSLVIQCHPILSDLSTFLFFPLVLEIIDPITSQTLPHVGSCGMTTIIISSFSSLQHSQDNVRFSKTC